MTGPDGLLESDIAGDIRSLAVTSQLTAPGAAPTKRGGPVLADADTSAVPTSTTVARTLPANRHNQACRMGGRSNTMKCVRASSNWLFYTTTSVNLDNEPEGERAGNKPARDRLDLIPGPSGPHVVDD